jgi:hypothetical protein
MRLRYRPMVVAALVAAGISATVCTASVSAATARAAAGRTAWKASYVAANKGAQATSVAVSPGGSAVYVTGVATTASGEPEYATVAYDATSGKQIWAAAFPAKTVGDPAVAVSPGGSQVYVTGAVYIAGHDHSGPVTLAYDAATGAVLWTYQPVMQDLASPASLAVSPGGSAVYVLGWEDADPGKTGYVIALDAATGTQLWLGTYQYKKNPVGFAEYGLAPSPDGADVFMTGSGGLVAFDAGTGALVWADAFSHTYTSGEIAYSVAVSPDSSTVFVAGRISSKPKTAYWTAAYDAATGASVWSATYQGQAVCEATSVAVTPNGAAVIVTGTTTATTPKGMKTVTVAYDPATGAQLWLASYRNERPALTYTSTPRLAVAPDSSTVTVTGVRAENGHPAGYVTLTYDAGTGAHEVTSTYQAPGDQPSLPVGIAVSPDGSTAFVTGWSGYTATTGDPASFLTFAYRI